MQRSVRHFVRRILGIHLLLLALLLAVVVGAARHVYDSARTEALEQAQERQQLLASQTARGISGFYNSILGDLQLLKPDPTSDDTDTSDLPPQPLEPKAFAGLGIIRQAAGAMLARQLQGRAYLFVVDEQMRPHQLGAEEKPLRPFKGTGKNKGFPPPPVNTTTPTSFETETREIITNFSPWLKEMNDAGISPMKIIAEHSIKLVCVPLFTSQRVPSGAGSKVVTKRTGWLVAVVRAKHIEDDFLADLYRHQVSGACLIDESMTIMAASPHELIGTRLDDRRTDPELAQFLTHVKRELKPTNTASISRAFRIDGHEFEPAMLSAVPVKEVLGKQWFVLVASPLKEVDSIVRDLSSKALFWAIFVAVSMTAILVSTSAQLILSRMRMERVRHQALQNEMRQARQIQLAWLPQKTKTLCSSSVIDIASLNRPATHISGDFYNFFELPDGRTAVVIGDVTGHGMAAAFLMATTQLLIRNTLPRQCDPGRCLEEVNHQLTNQVFNGQFVTMQILVIDSRTGEVAISTAGHPAPLISDGDGFHSLKLEPQLVAGVDARIQYATERFRLKPGASLLLYTDGVVETEDRSGKLLRLEGLCSALKGKVDTAEALLQRAVSAVNTFRGGVDLHDDLTLVAVHFLPQPRVITQIPTPTTTPRSLPSPKVQRVP